jgi:predicted TPR repeat methyltransferase
LNNKRAGHKTYDVIYMPGGIGRLQRVLDLGCGTGVLEKASRAVRRKSGVDIILII